jgi:signal transduction histidine kinase/CheY-like chemotaxis protein
MNDTPRLLHLEDRDDDAVLVRLALLDHSLSCDVLLAKDGDEFRAAVARGNFDVILSDSSVTGFDGMEALKLTRQINQETPFIFVCGDRSPSDIAALKSAGATDFISKNDLSKLVPAIQRALQLKTAPPLPKPPAKPAAPTPPPHPMERLIAVIQQLSLARDLAKIMEIVRHAARELTGADGATFVLREGDQCHYAEENAISPLWKGCRFPMSTCISGWTMLNRQSAVIEDIYADPRIPADAYRPTFVKSLVMVPIRQQAPIGAIGTYWAAPHLATPQEVQLLQALADSTSIAMENVALYADLENRVRERTAELQAAYRDMESFSYSVSHDLRAPLRSVTGFGKILQQRDSATLDETGRGYLSRMLDSATHMGYLIDSLLQLASLGRASAQRAPVDLAGFAREIIADLRERSPEREVEVILPAKLMVEGDPDLLRSVIENLLSNAWKYSSKRIDTRVEFGTVTGADGRSVYFVRDNGAGFNPDYADKLFRVFQRLHAASEFPGTGVGLATVQRIIQKHGGNIWAESVEGEGATFYFTLG